MQKINLITLGCSKNLVDTENLATQLNSNYKIVFDGNVSDSKIAIINTCGFINDAKQESIDTILDYVNAKQQNKIDKLFVTGCLSERYKDSLRKEIPEVDKYFGSESLYEILEHLKIDFKKELLGERKISTPSHYAYLKISEGCNRKCSFCAIPLIRGKHKSVPMEVLVSQAKNLAKKGVKELILIAQDSSLYGYDLYKKYALAELLEKLSEITEIEWIRLHYTYPVNFPTAALKVINEKDNICNYIDIPFQHISSEVLKKMRRGHDGQKIYELINLFKKEISPLSLRTTLIVGHPGETEQDFEELKKFVSEVEFDRLGVFTYSHEEDTFAGDTMEDIIPEEVKMKRAKEIMAIQQEISLENNYKKIGLTMKILVDRLEDEIYIGRTEFDSPEVDNEVIIETDKELEIGQFYYGKIVNALEFDLIAKV